MYRTEIISITKGIIRRGDLLRVNVIIVALLSAKLRDARKMLWLLTAFSFPGRSSGRRVGGGEGQELKRGEGRILDRRLG